MVVQSTLDRTSLIELIRTLPPLERQLLLKLSQKGPSLLLELAMSILKFPEDIRQPVQTLRDNGLIVTTAFDGGNFGPDVFDLSDNGRQVVRLLRDPALQSELAFAQPSATPMVIPVDSRQSEAELLEKLGDAAMKGGDSKGALDYYKQALEITRGKK